MPCDNCPLNGRPRIKPRGDIAANWIIVGEAPGCVSGDTLIDTAFRDKSIYPNGMPIKDLVDKKDIYVYSFDTSKNALAIGKVKRIWKTGTKKVFKVTYSWYYNVPGGTVKKQDCIKVTQNHPFLLKNTEYGNDCYLSIEEGLSVGHKLQPFYRFVQPSGYYSIGIKCTKHSREGRFLTSFKYNKQLNLSEQCHHMDENKFNDSWENLQLINISKHTSLHLSKTNPMWNSETKEKHSKIMQSEAYKYKMSNVMKSFLQDPANRQQRIEQIHRDALRISQTLKERYKDPTFYMNYLLTRKKVLNLSDQWLDSKFSERFPDQTSAPDNHVIISIEPLEEEDVYDMDVETYHNFAAQGIFVHNSEEAKQGLPFVGPSGKKLSEWLKAVGIPESQCWITNTVMCHPINNAVPTPEAINCCRRRLQAELDSVWGDIIITMGATATSWFVPTLSISAIRGIPEVVDGKVIIPTYHPSFALRNADMEKFVLADLQLAKDPQWLLDRHEKHRNTPRIYTQTSDAEELLRYLSDNEGVIGIHIAKFSPSSETYCVGLSTYIGTGVMFESHHGMLLDALRKFMADNTILWTGYNTADAFNRLRMPEIETIDDLVQKLQSIGTMQTGFLEAARRLTGQYAAPGGKDLACAKNADIVLGMYYALMEEI